MFPEPLSPARSNRSLASLIDALERVAVNFFRCFCKRHNHLEHAARALRANYCDSDRFNQNPRPRRQHRSKQGTGKLVCYLSPLNKVDNLPACSLAGSQQRRKQRKQRPNAFVPWVTALLLSGGWGGKEEKIVGARLFFIAAVKNAAQNVRRASNTHVVDRVVVQQAIGRFEALLFERRQIAARVDGLALLQVRLVLLVELEDNCEKGQDLLLLMMMMRNRYRIIMVKNGKPPLRINTTANRQSATTICMKSAFISLIFLKQVRKCLPVYKTDAKLHEFVQKLNHSGNEWSVRNKQHSLWKPYELYSISGKWHFKKDIIRKVFRES